MPTSSSPLSDIVSFISTYWVVILVVLIWIARMIGSAARGSTRPPAGGPRPLTPTAAPPPPRPSTLPRPQQPMAQPRPQQTAQAGQRFRPQPQAGQARTRAVSSSDRTAQERADIGRFAAEVKDMESSVPKAPGTSLTSSPVAEVGAGGLFDPAGPLGGQGAEASLLRAIVLAEVLGRRRIGPPRVPGRPPAGPI